ncbi:Endoplasmic reticulum chaperone BiP [Cichlidogyrus casuarinus]|uniref:Endoplasmic reticulum chaperone BIP n=1 Tax=Cichlidogyrus casuarinus TaxID=1844966 RepID=A0ABD2QGW4_9PLAT
MQLRFCALLFAAVALSSCISATDEKTKDQKPEYGTLRNSVGAMHNGRIEIIPNDQGNRITPSYVAFTEDGTRLIGDAAKNQLTNNPKNTIFDVKRIIGRTWADEKIQDDIKHFPFKIIEKDSKPHIEVEVGKETKQFTPEEISAMVLSKMKSVAEEFLGKKVTHAVITVPAYFNDAQRQATKNAGTIAGLSVLRIINEPTAAAIAYGLDKKKKDTGSSETHVLVFDLGGGTFDVSLLTIDQGVFEVIATSGNTHLGGEDFDQRVIDHFVKVFQKKKSKNITKDQRSLQKLRREVEKAKRALSSAPSTRIEIESLMDGEDFSETLTRAKFEELNNDLFKSTLEPVQKVLDDAKISKSEVDDVVLVGGSTRIPKVQELVKEFFDGREPNTGINPDEAVAYGAAVQGSVLSGDNISGDLLLLDVCPLTLGMELESGIMAKLINRNTPIPTVKKDTFTTVVDNQNSVVTSVYEGERPMAKDNHFLGEFELTGIPPAPRGAPQIEVTFEIDANGILKERLTPDQIEKMIKQAEQFAESDEKIRRRIEALNKLEGYCYQMNSQFSEENFSKNLSTEDVKSAKDSIADAISWVDSNKNDQNLEKSAFDARRESLEKILAPLVKKAYEAGKKSSKDEL